MSHYHDHTHEHMTVAQLEKHVRSWHKDGPLPGLYEPHGATHVFDKGPSNHDSDSARIDLHPWAEKLMPEAEVVFASIEGVQKADSMLTAILQDGLKASVYSVPSVTLWEDPKNPNQTRDFVNGFIGGKTVIIVPDSDWFEKEAVENQARIYHGYLLSLGIPRVHIAAAPDAPDGSKQGVDDFLGPLRSDGSGGGGSLGQLLCIDVLPPDRDEVIRWFEKAVAKSDRPNQNIGVLAGMATSLSMFAVAGTRGGRLQASQSTVARVLGVGRTTVQSRLTALTALGAIEVEGSLESKRNYFGTYDWEHKPTITIVPEELRSVRLEEQRTLEQVLGASFFEGRS